jgi:hypothetical protein
MTTSTSDRELRTDRGIGGMLGMRASFELNIAVL